MISRRIDLPRFRAGYICWVCKEPITAPDDGQLDHTTTPAGNIVIRGWVHLTCRPR